MLLIRTYLSKSKIPNAGVGLFTDQFIRAGEEVAISTPDTHDVFTDEEYDNASESFRNFLTDYGCHQGNAWILEKDNEKFANHSRNCNLTPDGIAKRDIAPGEELTYDYREVDDSILENPPDWL